jgi:hypothetical protein
MKREISKGKKIFTMAAAEKLANDGIDEVPTFLYIHAQYNGTRRTVEATIISFKNTDTEHEENNDKYYVDQLAVPLDKKNNGSKMICFINLFRTYYFHPLRYKN